MAALKTEHHLFGLCAEDGRGFRGHVSARGCEIFSRSQNIWLWPASAFPLWSLAVAIDIMPLATCRHVGRFARAGRSHLGGDSRFLASFRPRPAPFFSFPSFPSLFSISPLRDLFFSLFFFPFPLVVSCVRFALRSHISLDAAMDGNLGMTPSQDLPLEGQIRAIGGGGAGGGVVDLLVGAGGCRETASSVVGSVSTEWTDEKHSLYLNSMEESFVNQLYNHEFCFNNLFSWTSRISEDAGTPVSQIRHLCSGQFKVLHGGFWGEVKFERPQTQADIQKESHLLSRSPWIRRFMSTPRDKEAELSTAEHMGGYPAVKTEIYVTGQRHNDGECRETAHMSQLYACSTHPCPLDSVGIDTEVSDQNFVDVSVGAKQSTRIRKRKRSRTTSSNVNVQDASFGETPATSNGDESLADATCSGTEEANL